MIVLWKRRVGAAELHGKRPIRKPPQGTCGGLFVGFAELLALLVHFADQGSQIFCQFGKAVHSFSCLLHAV